MKKTNLLKTLLAVFLLCNTLFSIQAKDFYISTVGNDKNDGSEQKPLATFSRAVTLADHGDVIHIKGFIDMTKEPNKPESTANNDIDPKGAASYEVNGITYNTWNVKGNNGVRVLFKKITIIGDDKATCGFDGKNATRLLRIDGSGVLSFKNLTFKNGNNEPNKDFGCGVYIRMSNPTFDNCDFIDNKSTGNFQGGAISIRSAATFKNCTFSGNSAKEGAAFYVISGNINIENCIIKDNDASLIANSSGAGIAVNLQDKTTINVKRTVIANNKTNKDGGAISLWDSGSKLSKADITFESCAINFNETDAGNGGALSFNNKLEGFAFNLSFINSTIYGNKAKVFGGAMYFSQARTGSELNIINCTITENEVKASSAGYTGGIRFNDIDNTGASVTSTKNLIKRIYNSIIENNFATEDPTANMDISFRAYNPENNQDFFMNNSYVGKILANPAYESPLENNNNINYGKDQAGLQTPTADFIKKQNYIPLKSKSKAINAGDAQYLKKYTISTDQTGAPRSFNNNKCSIGAVEVQ